MKIERTNNIKVIKNEENPETPRKNWWEVGGDY
jgi:hypothetical protein